LPGGRRSRRTVIPANRALRDQRGTPRFRRLAEQQVERRQPPGPKPLALADERCLALHARDITDHQCRRIPEKIRAACRSDRFSIDEIVTPPFCDAAVL
jgi:hypothetical protein